MESRNQAKARSKESSSKFTLPWRWRQTNLLKWCSLHLYLLQSQQAII